MFADQDEEKGCWYLALWILQEDSSWRRLVIQVSLLLSAAFLLFSFTWKHEVNQTETVSVDMHH